MDILWIKFSKNNGIHFFPLLIKYLGEFYLDSQKDREYHPEAHGLFSLTSWAMRNGLTTAQCIPNL